MRNLKQVCNLRTQLLTEYTIQFRTYYLVKPGLYPSGASFNDCGVQIVFINNSKINVVNHTETVIR